MEESNEIDEVIRRLIQAITEVQSVLGKDVASLADISDAVRRYDFDSERVILHFIESAPPVPQPSAPSAQTPAAAVSRFASFAAPQAPWYAPEPEPEQVFEIPDNLSPNTQQAIRNMLEEEESIKRKDEQEETMTLQFLKEESKHNQKILDEKRYVCDICFGETSIDEIYILEDCFHRYCRECLGDHCKSQIVGGNTR